ncbi:MAG: hypothetical protein EA379_08730 [Phycisphaerales bacterium]|nr:MAG: hypothetical protein EA379_08730 [Phycisphaerales bacterium]
MDHTEAAGTTAEPQGEAPRDEAGVVSGVCYAMFAYDVGLSVQLDEAERRITDATSRTLLRRRRRSPRYFDMQPAPLRVTHLAPPIALGGFSTSDAVESVIFDFGAVSVTYAIHFRCTLRELLTLSETLYDNDTLHEEARSRVETLAAAIRPAVAKPRFSSLVEDYVLYDVRSSETDTGVDAMLDQHRAMLARVLRSEPGELSRDEISDALSCRISYSPDDAALIDWNAAIAFGPEDDDLRSVLEYVNVELLEMRYLDDQLDEALDRAMQTMSRQQWWRHFLPGAASTDLRHMAELQMDSALLFEGVNNALKLIGDQHLARVYRLASQRMHLPQWDASIIRKLDTADSIYQKLTDQQATVRLEVLEWIIIVLIAISIVLMLV